MDNGTYADPSIVALINRHFIPVRVDTDRRPDINERYNLGGWPTTAVLAPDGTVLLGGTYVPREQMPRFLSAAIERFRAWRPGALEREPEPHPLPPSHAAVGQAFDAARNAFDPAHGGFGAFPKFPHQDVLEFLAFLAGRGNAEARRMLAASLDGMAEGEIHDKVGGGFYRYATQQDWSMPHFEKLLEDNARLLRIYLDAYALTGSKRYAAVAEDTLFFLTSVLLDRERFAFHASQDADEEYCRLAYEERERRGPPAVDRTFFADWNSWTVTALLRAGVVLGDDGYTTLGLRCLDFILANHLGKDGVAHVWDGKARPPFLLRDHAVLLQACLDGWNATLGRKYLAAAERIAGLLAGRFQDFQRGGFYDLPAVPGAAGRLAVRRKDLVLNGIAALGLLRLASAAGKAEYRAMASTALEAVGSMARGHGMYGAAYALAAEALLKGCVEVTLDGRDVAGLHRAALGSLDPRLVIRRGKRAGPAAARICKEHTCLPPARTVQGLASRLR
jgi:hypothetical protein